MLKEIFVKDVDIKSLVEHGYLIEEHAENAKWYSLGPNGLLLINAWEMEELSRKMTYLTYAILILTAVSIIISMLRIWQT